MGHRRFPAELAIAVLTLAAVIAIAAGTPAQSFAQTAHAHRIITIAPNAAEILTTLGAADRIVAVSKFCLPLPALVNKPRIGGLIDPDLEKIVSLQPDLLVLRGRNEAIDELARQENIPVYHDQTDSLAGIETCITKLGDVVGLRKQAQALLASFRADLSAVEKSGAGQPRPRVFVTLSRHPERLANLLTAGPGTFVDEMIQLAGGKNIFSHIEMAYPQVSPESILARQPDVIIEFLPERELPPDLQKHLLDQWRELGPMPATQSGRIYFITDPRALIPSPSVIKTIRTIHKYLHPAVQRD